MTSPSGDPSGIPQKTGVLVAGDQTIRLRGGESGNVTIHFTLMEPFSPLENSASVVSILARIPIFGGVNDVQQEEIFKRLETVLVKRGQYVFQKGDEPSHIYIVESGLIELFIPDKELMIEKKRLGIGECFGQVAVMSIHQHTISAVALEDTSLIVLSRRALYQLHREDLELFALLITNIARELARRLQFMDHLLLESIHTHEGSKASSVVGGP